MWYEHRVCPHTHMYAAPPPYTITKQVGKALVRAFERTDRGVIQKVHHAFEIGLGNVAKVRKNKQAQSIGSRMVWKSLLPSFLPSGPKPSIQSIHQRSNRWAAAPWRSSCGATRSTWPTRGTAAPCWGNAQPPPRHQPPLRRRGARPPLAAAAVSGKRRGQRRRRRRPRGMRRWR